MRQLFYGIAFLAVIALAWHFMKKVKDEPETEPDASDENDVSG
jgi:hypothetical protein